MPKRAKKEEIERFRLDMRLLRARYSNDEIAKKLSIDPTNLSSCYTGKKNPGATLINKFNMNYESELKDQKPQESDPTPSSSSPENDQTPVVEEPAPDYMRAVNDGGEEAYKSWTNLDKMVDSHHHLTKSQLELSAGNHILAKNNERLTEAHISLIDRVKKSGDTQSPSQNA